MLTTRFRVLIWYRFGLAAAENLDYRCMDETTGSANGYGTFQARGRLFPRLIGFAVAIFGLVALVACGSAREVDVILATTTSTYDSGLLDVLIPDFES